METGLAIVAEVIDSVDVVNAGSTSQSKRFSETIIEINPESLDIVWKWRAWDSRSFRETILSVAKLRCHS